MLWALIGRRLKFQESSSPSEIVDLHFHTRFGAFASPPSCVSDAWKGDERAEDISLKGPDLDAYDILGKRSCL